MGAIIRDQFSSFFNNGYRTQGFFAETNLPYAFKPHHWTSVGVFFDGDKTGDLSFGSRRIGFNLAYHLALDDDYQNVLSIGGQYSNVTRQIDTVDAFGQDADDPTLLQYMTSFSDINFGISFKSKVNKKTVFEVGTGLYLSLIHI